MVAVSQLIPLLANGYAEKCKKLGIIQRQREIKTPEDLMLLSLFHLVNGCTLLEISEIGRLAKIGEFSDVAFMNRFAKCAEWFTWISEQLTRGIVANYRKPTFLDQYRAIAFDASDVMEKGRSGQTYRFHYGIDIFKMSSVTYKITKQEVGETLLNFELKRGDLAIGDRVYGTENGIIHCVGSQADYLLRLRTNCFAIYDDHGDKIDMLSKLGDLDYEESTDFSGCIHSGKTYTPVRICAKRKPKEACEAALKKLRRRASKKQMQLSEKTEQFNEYIVIATSLTDEATADDILEAYRYRWQVECYFKRLKSIMGFGDLPKKCENSSLSWLNGKIMVALMIETLLSQDCFSPCHASQPQA